METNIVMTTQLLTINRAAEKLSVSRSSLYKLVARGDLRIIKIGKAARIADADIDAFIARMRAV